MTQIDPKRFYHGELQELRDHLLLMASRAIESVNLTMQALEELDASVAEQVLANDDILDELEIRIDAEATRYMTLRAPVASELRLVMVAMKASHDLERIGDEATNIAKRTIRLVGSPHAKDLAAIPEMKQLVVAMVDNAITSLIEEDAELAFSLPAKDKAIDALHKQNYVYFTERLGLFASDAANFVDLIFISKALERIADHGKNIAEEVVYLLKAADIRHADKR
jgi:phosphate transport system protein